mmetsp:Transcript_27752/g.59669  ORF Transcript_27752/g.59669 Transcript_27752/m.59669 type:complete len:261 (+) Transcript_27752:721-1503(+)
MSLVGVELRNSDAEFIFNVMDCCLLGVGDEWVPFLRPPWLPVSFAASLLLAVFRPRFLNFFVLLNLDKFFVIRYGLRGFPLFALPLVYVRGSLSIVTLGAAGPIVSPLSILSIDGGGWCDVVSTVVSVAGLLAATAAARCASRFSSSVVVPPSFPFFNASSINAVTISSCRTAYGSTLTFSAMFNSALAFSIMTSSLSQFITNVCAAPVHSFMDMDPRSEPPCGKGPSQYPTAEASVPPHNAEPMASSASSVEGDMRGGG